MKKIYILILLTVITFNISGLNAQQTGLSTVPSENDTYLRVNQTDQTQYINQTGGDNILIPVETNLTYTVKSNHKWCKAEIIEQDLKQKVKISVDEANTNLEVRTAVVSIQAKDGYQIEINVNQQGTTPSVLVTEKSITVLDAEYTFYLNITSNILFTFELPDWITAIDGTPATGRKQYTFQAGDYENENQSRRGEIVIKPQDNTVQEIKIPVEQIFSGLPGFAVISDIHFGNSKGQGPMYKVPQALKNLIAKGIDALFVVGDLTDHCYETEWQQFKQVFTDQSIVPQDLPVYFMMGNHDFYTNSREVCEGYYLQYTEQPLHQYIEIKGYPFITLSMSGKSGNDYSPEAIEFLKVSLDDASRKYPGKAIFVMSHVPPTNTVYGSNSNDGNWGTTKYEDILKNYPQIIIFSGHSHFPLADPRSIYQKNYTAINDGSTTYGEIEPQLVNKGIHPENSENVTEGLIVRVDKHKNVSLERWDTYRNEEIAPKWLVNAPHDGSNFIYKDRDGKPAPQFIEGSKPIISDKTTTSFNVQFPRATDNEVVHHYIIEVLNGNNIEKTFKRFSEFYINSTMPSQYTISFTGITSSNVALKVRVTAVDSYFNQSEPIISDEFTLAGYLEEKKTLFDILFQKDGIAIDGSEMKTPVITGSVKPQTYTNTTYNKTTAKFTGNNQAYYKIDYSGNQAIKDAFSNGFTFEALYMVNNTTSTMSAISAQESGGAGLEQKTDFQFWVHLGGSYKKVVTTSKVTAGRFYHVIAVYDKKNSKIAMYIDGEKAGETTVTGDFTFPSNVAAQWIGIGGDACAEARVQSPLDGEIAIARMYSWGLTEDEAKSLYNQEIKP